MTFWQIALYIIYYMKQENIFFSRELVLSIHTQLENLKLLGSGDLKCRSAELDLTIKPTKFGF